MRVCVTLLSPIIIIVCVAEGVKKCAGEQENTKKVKRMPRQPFLALSSSRALLAKRSLDKDNRV